MIARHVIVGANGVKLGSAADSRLLGTMAMATGSYRPVLFIVAAGPLLATLLMPWATPPRLQTARWSGDKNVMIAWAGLSGIQHAQIRRVRAP